MSTTFIGITYDAQDAQRVAEFWGAVLGRQVADGASAEHATLIAEVENNTGPRIGFHKVPEGKTVKNRLHIDLLSTEFDTELQRVLSLGATTVAEQTAVAIGSLWPIQRVMNSISSKGDFTCGPAASRQAHTSPSAEFGSVL